MIKMNIFNKKRAFTYSIRSIHYYYSAAAAAAFAAYLVDCRNWRKTQQFGVLWKKIS
jgi:hypothetical protein